MYQRKYWKIHNLHSSNKNKVIIIDKKGKEITKNISHRLQLIDSAIFIASSLSNLVDNLAERIHKIKCKNEHNDMKCKTCGIKHKDCDCFLEHKNIKLNGKQMFVL